MNIPLSRAWTQDEFFAWADGQDGLWEFDGFRPVDMTGGTVNHAIIVGNLHFALRTGLRSGPCRFLGPDTGLATIGQTIRYPDAVVTCAKPNGSSRLVDGAVIVFEVLSPSTSRSDRIDKVREYAAVPSIRRYVIVEHASIGLTVLARDGSGEIWRATTLSTGEVLKIPEVGIEVSVDDLYEGVDFTS